MKILQRRAKRNSSVTGKLSGSAGLSERIAHYQNALITRWQALSSRDQLALSVLLVFLLLFVGGYGGYSVHQAAKDSKLQYQEQVADYFWLRSQASNIDPAVLSASTADDANAIPPANQLNTLLNESGIENAQVVAAGDTVQLSFSHPSQAVVSAALGRLKQQGWQFMQLTVQQEPTTKMVQVQGRLTL